METFLAPTTAGSTAIGGWGYTGTFDRFNGGTGDGTEGFYLVFDQSVWRENPDDEDDEQGLGVFFQYGWADQSVSEIEHHIGGGVAWTGTIPTRDDDVLGLGATAAELSDATGPGFSDNGELAIKLFYKVQITPFISIKPDVQYIINPGGAGLRDAVVGTLRAEVAF